MNKIVSLLIIIAFFTAFMSVVSAENLDFRLDVNKKAYYPNEKVHLNISIINRDQFSVKDAILLIHISDRFYSFNLGDMKAGDTFNKEIILSEFPPGTQNIQGELNYTGFLDERFTEISYGSFEVLFPPVERYPRNIFVSDYHLPDKVIAGKEYNVSATIKNDGDVKADLVIEFGYIDEYVSEASTLNPGETKTIKRTVKFNNPGVSLLETRIYALINGDKYLLNYQGKKTYTQEERVAKLSFDKLELVDEPDNQINQDDSVKLKIYIKNEGETATDVMGEIRSNDEKIFFSNPNISFGLVSSGQDSAGIVDINTKGAIEGNYDLILKLNYVDSENRIKPITIPIIIYKGEDKCSSNTDCLDTQTCENSKCVEVPCECGEVRNRQCTPYACCSKEDCKGFDQCNITTHSCIKCSDEHCCAQGTIWCRDTNSCTQVKECLLQTKNSICKGNSKGMRISINNAMDSCNLFEVTNENVKNIASSVIDICAEQYTTELEIQDCAVKYIVNGLEKDVRWMKGYYYGEICCTGSSYCYENNPFNRKYIGTCQPYSGNSNSIQTLSCFEPTNGIYWSSDVDLSKNSCSFSDLPVHASLFTIKTGTCVDYSVALTTLLREVGMKDTDVMSTWGGGHAYNLIKLPGNTKYIFADTVGNSGGGLQFTPKQAWFPYCDSYRACANDNGYINCPSRENIIGC